MCIDSVGPILASCYVYNFDSFQYRYRPCRQFLKIKDHCFQSLLEEKACIEYGELRNILCEVQPGGHWKLVQWTWYRESDGLPRELKNAKAQVESVVHRKTSAELRCWWEKTRRVLSKLLMKIEKGYRHFGKADCECGSAICELIFRLRSWLIALCRDLYTPGGLLYQPIAAGHSVAAQAQQSDHIQLRSMTKRAWWLTPSPG